jgi:hypothetical protein
MDYSPGMPSFGPDITISNEHSISEENEERRRSECGWKETMHFSEERLAAKDREQVAKKFANSTMQSVFSLARKLYPKYMQRMDAQYSHGISREGLNRDEMDNSRYWANPLQIELPKAKDFTVYCLYGTGLSTERGYRYR